MPTNKNASIRYQALDKCFRDRRHRYYIEDLLQKCEEALYYYNGVGGVSKRQLFEDIKFMESDTGWSIPLERKKDGKKVYYRYEDSDFTINEQPLTDEEAQQLKALIITLSRFRGLPSNEWMEEVISNLEWRFNLKGGSENIIGFEQNQELKGLYFLTPIIEATANHQVLEVVYQNYKIGSEPKKLILHPYYVKQYNNRWFLLALDNEKHYISNLALDRIVSVQVTDKILYVNNKTIDFEHYFDDVIGVTIPVGETKKELIKLRFTEKQFPYIVSKPIHKSQIIIDEEKRVISIEVIPNYELDQQILSYGPDVEVLAPISYREHFSNKIGDLVNIYGLVKNHCTE